MKKTQPKLSDPRKSEVLDGAKRQYRIVAEASRQLEEKQRRVQTCAELFQPDLLARRSRLAELCERLALAEPSLFGRSAEELLWKKTYYDVFSMAKRLRKSNNWNAPEKALVQKHLFAGLGNYHALVLRLQAEFQLDLRGVYDLPHCLGDGSLSNYNMSRRAKEQGSKDWAMQGVYRSLIAMGDLTRYLIDFSPTCTSEQAARFYLQAACIESKAGMPYNQLGTLSGTQNHSLDGAFYYMRCLASEQVFDGAEGNLQRLMERSAALLLSGHAPSNPQQHVRSCAARILMLADSWFFNRSMATGREEVCCETLNDIQQCLSYSQPEPLPNTDTSTPATKIEELAFLDDNALFRIIGIALMCISSLQSKNSPMLDVAVRFTLGILGHIIQHILSLLELKVPQSASNGHSNSNNGKGKQKKDKKKKKKKLRRRRKNSSDDESDISQGEGGSSESSSEAGSEEESEPELSSSSEEEDQVPSSDTKTSQEPTIQSVLYAKQGSLIVVKLCCDWLRGDNVTLQACASSSRSLLQQIIKLLNIVADTAARSAVGKEDLLKVADIVPLPEDLSTRGIAVLSSAQQAVDWKYWRLKKLNPRDEILLRMYKLVNFGHFLTEVDDMGVTFNPTSGDFCVAQDVPLKQQPKSKTGAPTNGSESRRQLMRHMGQLWLKEEVRSLESRVKKSECNFSPYLVVDREALLQCMHLVKQLVFSKKFVVIIPCVVVSALDELKGESGRAREAIRWLETQFQRGNRFLRAQRSNESLALPLIKYPKKKEKDAWVFFKVMECCSHLAQHSAAGTSQPAGVALVTLLTGGALDADATKDFSPQGLAQSAGIKLESISSFCAKLKSSSKNHG